MNKNHKCTNRNSGSNKPNGKSNNRNRYRGNSSRNKGSLPKTARQVTEIVDTENQMSQTNDISWYTGYAQFARDVSTLPFGQPLGTVIDIKDESAGSNVNASFTIPGLMSINFYPTIGVAHDFTAPINRSSINYWTYLRSVQKAAGSYDHQDITMMVLAIDSALMYHSFMRRIYGILSLFTPINQYYPRTLLKACNVDYDDLIMHISDLRAYINQFAMNLGQYQLPSGISLFDRHRWMCEGLYLDSEGSKAQTYMFTPNGFWQYNNTVASGSQLDYKGWRNPQNLVSVTTLKTFDDIVAFGDDLLNAMSNDEDFAMISGDMRVLYGNKTYNVPFTEELYRVLPVYDKTVASQIENLRCAGVWAQDYTPVITQNPKVNAGAIIFEPELDVNATNIEFDALAGNYINIHGESPSPDQVMESTRLKYTSHAVESTSTAGYKLVIDSCGTEIVTNVSLWTQVAGMPSESLFNHTAIVMSESTDAEVAQEYMLLVTLMSNFDWAPIFEYWTSTNQQYQLQGLLGDIDNLVSLSDNYLDNINAAALYSLFDLG